MQAKLGYRPRRPHEKSRNGCLTCKQRRIKCDEGKPSCNQCQSSLRVCTYGPTASVSSGLDEPIAALSLQGQPGPSSDHSSSSGLLASSFPEPRSSASALFNTTIAQHTAGSETSHELPSFSDANLYRHFVEHACRFTQGEYENRSDMQYMTTLEPQSETIRHSIMALAAACLCCDLISAGTVDPDIVRQGLDLGLNHHTIALEQMHNMIEEPFESNVDILLANAALLFPFAFAFQHINHWVLCNMDSPSSHHSVSPRDAVILLRGLRACITTLQSNKTDKMRESQSTTPPRKIATPVPLRLDGRRRTHIMFPIVASTSQQAFHKLQQRLDLESSDLQGDASGIAACSSAFDILSSVMTDIFVSSEPTVNSVKYSRQFSATSDSLLAQTPSWLRSYATRPPNPFAATEPLSRTLFAFFFNVPQEYLDILLPLLDEMSDEPTDASHDQPEPTSTEILALDIYAHWLVLLVLIESESWWVRSFPIVGLQGLVQKYNGEFTSGNPAFGKRAGEGWWPGSMLEVITQVGQWR